MSELKTIASIRDNMSTGLMAIQKEQQRIRNEMQGAKEVLKGTLVKKWSIKLQAGELLKCMWELVKEIGLLREQLAMIPQGLIGEKYSVGTLAVEHIVLQNLVPTNDNEEKPENSTLNLRNFDNESNIDENNIKKESDGLSAEMLTSAISGLIILAATRNPTAATAVGTGAAAAAGTEGSAAAGAAKTVEKWGPFVAKSSEKWTKRASEYIDGASKTASNFEQQELRYDHALSIFSPKKEADEIKAERENYMKQLMDSAVYDGFKIDDMFDAGITGLDITGGDTKKAMEYIKIAKNIVGWNPGSTVEEVMEALSSAKQGKLDELRSFGTVISAKDFENKGFEEVLQNNIAPQFKDGTTRRMNTLDGLETASESAKEIDRLFSGK
ncbi:MAG TPA: hypothetical protein VN580_04665, partial [Clostridia bacterium]|nr:hypothetical protein [Clostridia bacterium]